MHENAVLFVSQFQWDSRSPLNDEECLGIGHPFPFRSPQTRNGVPRANTRPKESRFIRFNRANINGEEVGHVPIKIE